ISDAHSPHALPLVVSDVNVELNRVAKTPGADPSWQAYGTTGRPLAEKITFSGEFDPTTWQMDCICDVVNLEITREFMAAAPVFGFDTLQGLELQGRADFQFEAHRQPGKDAPLKWEVKDFR